MPTMQDVANKAGVTLSTVSHALSGKRPISEETRARIQQAIDELGYHPNELARRLANKESKILGLFFPKYKTGLSEMQFEFVSAAIDAAEKEGYAILLWRSPKDVEALVNLTQQGLVDGVIFMEVRINDPWMIRLRESGFPFAMIGRTEDNTDIGFVDLDHTTAIEEAFDYLVGMGHKKIAYINYSPKLVNSGYGPAVFCSEGYQKAIRKYDLPIIYGECEPTTKDAYHLLQKLLSDHSDLTALVTPNEAGLPGLYQAIRDDGRDIPADFSVVSLASPLRAERLLPTLTTMDFPTDEMGKVGVEILIKFLRQKNMAPAQKILKSKLSIRQSSGPPPVK
ncbi:MAG: LacI family DNA-binding transcriptional regulator [Anaerolineaceae bacterium]|nr:LacI family DNA-binding transcriptional regulator [Anaerolineaceae bacterium]